MSIIQANVPKEHLGTKIGTPNILSIEYSTEVLMPLAGPVFFYKILKDFMLSYLYLVKFIGFTEITLDFIKGGGKPGIMPIAYTDDKFSVNGKSKYAIVTSSVMKESAKKKSGLLAWLQSVFKKEVTDSALDKTSIKKFIQDALRNPNPVFKDALKAGILVADLSLFRKDFVFQDFNKRCQILLTELLKLKKDYVPQKITDVTTNLKDKAVAMAKARASQPAIKKLDKLPAETMELLVKWLVAMHAAGMSNSYNSAAGWAKDLLYSIGFIPFVPQREWAFRRLERLEMEFGTPDIRGPVMSEAVPPQGVYSRETYSSTSNELMMIASESRIKTTKELKGIGISPLQKSLNSIYYSGEDSLNNIVSQSGLSLLGEERRNTIHAYLQEVSEASENMEAIGTSRSTSTTVSYEMLGVDQKLACTQHRFKVVTPVKSTVYLKDLGLTWCPRIDNPFLSLRRAARKAYRHAFNEFKQQYYVPKPVRPGIVNETFVAPGEIEIDQDNSCADVEFSIPLIITERNESPDLNNWKVTFTQTDDWGFDPEDWTIWLENLSFTGTEIKGTVHIETSDWGDLEGWAHVEIPVYRYTKETIDALEKYEIEQEDFQLKLEALEAQAKQYARIKQREFIERHDRLDPINKILFEALIKRSLTLLNYLNHSYYKEIVARCVDWNGVKVEFESRNMDNLLYPDFPPDHFMNSPGVRFFLPILKTAEETLIDTLKQYGNFFVSASAESARDKIVTLRDELAAGGPKKLDEFKTEVIIGDHIEAVMSNHESAT